jgi:transcriptional regulator with XRE-family HTH domain
MDQAGDTGAALADECGVTRQAVSQWVNGASSPGPAHMVRILNKSGAGVFMVVGVQ